MSLEVQNDEKARQVLRDVDGHEAKIEYAKSGDVYDLMHTFVPEELRGHGVAEQLVPAALDQIKSAGGEVLADLPLHPGLPQAPPEYREGMAPPSVRWARRRSRS